MSEIKAMYAIAKQPILNPYISPKRLERVTKCCEHYKDLGYCDARQTSNILKRFHLTETAFTDRFLSRQQHYSTDEHRYQETIKTVAPFGEYLTKAKKIIVDKIVANGGID